jgi:sterol carrier protein 2
MEKHVTLMAQLTEISSAPFSAQMFGNAGIEHMKRYGTKPEHFAKIAYKNHKHSVNNPYSQFREEYSLDQIKNSPVISGILTKLQCCPTSDGSAAAVVVSERFCQKPRSRSPSCRDCGHGDGHGPRINVRRQQLHQISKSHRISCPDS